MGGNIEGIFLTKLEENISIKDLKESIKLKNGQSGNYLQENYKFIKNI